MGYLHQTSLPTRDQPSTVLPLRTTLRVMRPIRTINRIRREFDDALQIVELNRDVMNAVFGTDHVLNVDPTVSFLIDQAQHEIAALARMALVMKLLSLSYHHISKRRLRKRS